MKQIKQYIDNMFQTLPDTEEIGRIKNELYLNTLDRYEELIDQGNSENEALGLVIVEMGERDTLLEKFGYDQEQNLKKYSLNNLKEAKEFIALNNQESYKVGLGLMLILVGAGLVPTFDTFGFVEIGVILLLILVASAVGIFITFGLKLENLENNLYDGNHIFYMSQKDNEIIKNQFSVFKEKERYRISFGVMLCILAVIPILIFSFLDNIFFIERFGVVLLTSIVGIGVYQFIKYGMVRSAYEKILSIGEYSVDERRFQQRIEIISKIYWLSVNLIYFIWSFITMGWYYTWIVWPIAGVSWALISVLLRTFVYNEDYSRR